MHKASRTAPTGEHNDTIVHQIMSFSGNDGIDVPLAVDDKFIAKYVHNPQGFLDFLNVFMHLERTPTICAHTLDVVTDNITKGNMTNNYLNEMLHFRNQNAKSLIVGHLNINGLRNKFFEVNDMLTQSLLDMFFISETKLDISFPNAQFRVPGFKHYRADRNGNGGGIAAYIRNDLPHRRRSDLESMIVSPAEAMVIEVIIRKEVWLYYCVYNPHFNHKQTCCAMIDELIDASQTSRPSNIFLIGDLNINLMCENDCKCLKDVMDIHGLCNLIESPTCYKSCNPSLIDVLLTSHKRRIANVLNINTGISDFHNLIACSAKMHVPRNTNRLIYYRSYKHFDETSFKHDLEIAPFHVGDMFDEIWYVLV